MKIALFGYGKMGKAIEQLAIEAGDEVVLIVTRENMNDESAVNLNEVDVAIEFSSPAIAFQNIKICIDAGVPVVSGTTGWLDRLDEAKNLCLEKSGAFFYASNFSVGVHLFFAANQFLARIMDTQPAYDVSIEETHHIQKLDAPSGTAISLAQQILENYSTKSRWVSALTNDIKDLYISSLRVDKVPGTHVVRWQSAIDTIEIKHIAHSREGFASGALKAARWLIGKKGFFGMNDLLGSFA